MTPQELHVLPDSTQTAAQNMAHDFLLLNRYPDVNALRIRHYDWIRPAFTFGMSQTYNYALSEVSDSSAEICRRPTGGGVVNHLEDWTYSLVIPASHPLARSQPSESYRSVHDCIVSSMHEQGVEVILNFASPEHTAPSVCFEKPEVYDIVLRNLPTKVAGAAQKRSKKGYLLQGSIWRPALPDLDWTQFYNDFIQSLSRLAGADTQFRSWPDWDELEEEQLIERFESEEWNQRR